MKRHNPPTISPPLGQYSHGVEVPANARRLYISGQVGVGPDGTIPPDSEAQMEIIWTNIHATLASAGMTAADIVKVTTYITRAEDFAVHPRVRARHLGDNHACATGLLVAGLAKPELLVEIEVVAARAD
ncbi:RidA family protein [Fodinicurvata sp. EGI_FJ10296]|uniref:RidA family protein n=1 Tax=Fodinicurvata sp. EGI_FJ10296 TaxID=3231908 RepID=UPI003451A69F